MNDDTSPGSAIDHVMMARALRLAERGLWTTQPNPRVGCVIARDDEVVGEGFHARAGEPHAETFALRAAGGRARGATAYVTLEPCAHHGRTPPCADALIASGVSRVVVACEDPNPKAGGGIPRLRAAGIGVQTGLLREAARELNRGFLARLEHGRPWARVKLAMSLDGRTALANGTSKWITGDAARTDVQRWRARSSAILTGAGTARMDDPHLTARIGAGASPARSDARGQEAFEPLRVVLDARLDALAANAHLLDGGAPTLVLHAPGVEPPDDRYRRCERASVPVDGGGRLDLAAAMRILATRQVNELQVEAGPTLAGALFSANLVDELLLYVAPVLLGDAALPLLRLPPLVDMAQCRALRLIEQRQLGDAWRLLLRPDDVS